MDNDSNFDSYYEKIGIKWNKEQIFFIFKITQHIIQHYYFDRESVDFVLCKSKTMLKEIEEIKKEHKRHYRKIEDYICDRIDDWASTVNLSDDKGEGD